MFATRDGHVLTHVVGDGLFRRWARLMGDAERWTGDPRFATDDGRGTHSAAILERMRAWCAERDTASALEALAAAGLPAAQVLSPQQALDDAQAAAMAWFRPVADYPGLPRPAPVPDLPLRFSANTAGITRRPPLLGEHTDEVLRELGYDAAAIAELHRQGVT